MDQQNETQVNIVPGELLLPRTLELRLQAGEWMLAYLMRKERYKISGIEDYTSFWKFAAIEEIADDVILYIKENFCWDDFAPSTPSR